jgi:tRNA dimethylallyltransferase
VLACISRSPRITASLGHTPHSLVVITGPTAVGKSALALDLAQRLGGEIVSADSRQVYRYMDVGTAKPAVAERAAVPHHLVDVVYPNEPYSIAAYQEMGLRALADVSARGRAALLVGGSPHYIQALVDLLRPAPRNSRLRAWLERTDRASPPERLDTWLRALDPRAAREIDLRNRRRVLRALEVTLTTGRPFSQAGRQREPSLPAIWIGLRMERSLLHERVERRIGAMLKAEWLEEVRALLAMGYPATLPAMSATGYAELVRVLAGDLTLEDAVQHVRHATHAFIRRQETWMRAERRIHWLDAAEAERLLPRALQLLGV